MGDEPPLPPLPEDDPGENFTLPEWIPEKTWSEFQKVRKKKKAACTPYAHSLVVKELTRIRDELGQDPVVVLNKSITSGWSDVYPLKNGNGNRDHPMKDKLSPIGQEAYDVIKNWRPPDEKPGEVSGTDAAAV